MLGHIIASIYACDIFLHLRAKVMTLSITPQKILSLVQQVGAILYAHLPTTLNDIPGDIPRLESQNLEGMIEISVTINQAEQALSYLYS